MTLDIILIMAILTALVLLFISGWVRLDIVPFMVPLALIVTNLALVVPQVWPYYGHTNPI